MESGHADEADYAALVEAVHRSESLGDAAQMRESYDALLRDYPICYGYWKKYADKEFHASGSSSHERADAVHVRARRRARALVLY